MHFKFKIEGQVGKVHSSWKQIFNMFLCDLFYFLDDVTVTSYADDTTSYTVNKEKDLAKKSNIFPSFFFNDLTFTK